MINDTKTTEESDFEDAIAMMPDGVKEFMWDGALDYILDIAQKAIPLSLAEKASMKNAAQDLLIGITDMEQESKRMLVEGVEAEKVTKIMYIIHTEILTAAKNITEYEGYSAEEFSDQQISQNLPDTLSRINQAFTAPVTLAPTKRDYSAPAPTEQSRVPETPQKSVDPYREIPDA